MEFGMGSAYSNEKSGFILLQIERTKQPWSPRFMVEQTVVNFLETTSSFTFKAAALLENWEGSKPWEGFTWQQGLGFKQQQQQQPQQQKGLGLGDRGRYGSSGSLLHPQQQQQQQQHRRYHPHEDGTLFSGSKARYASIDQVAAAFDTDGQQQQQEEEQQHAEQQQQQQQHTRRRRSRHRRSKSTGSIQLSAASSAAAGDALDMAAVSQQQQPLELAAAPSVAGSSTASLGSLCCPNTPFAGDELQHIPLGEGTS
jgi:DNA-binding transcriptional MerR regulator